MVSNRQAASIVLEDAREVLGREIADCRAVIDCGLVAISFTRTLLPFDGFLQFVLD